MIVSRNPVELSALVYQDYMQAINQSASIRPYLAAIDGPCASGKTVLAKELKKQLEASYGLSIGLIELDHFFLPPALRTEARFAEPGGNIHYERFQQEVILPVLASHTPAYKVFDCGIMDYAEEIVMTENNIILIEGVYSHHPLWRDNLDLKIFCQADLDERLERIEKRDGQKKLKRFIDEWIPLEDKYFTTYNISESSDIMFQSDSSRPF
ncbi:MAG: AAA family ATPase [Clostridiaceae bacterium]|nr:AAA family ATPase [Clostridiaceae bacterium]